MVQAHPEPAKRQILTWSEILFESIYWRFSFCLTNIFLLYRKACRGRSNSWQNQTHWSIIRLVIGGQQRNLSHSNRTAFFFLSLNNDPAETSLKLSQMLTFYLFKFPNSRPANWFYYTVWLPTFNKKCHSIYFGHFTQLLKRSRFCGFQRTILTQLHVAVFIPLAFGLPLQLSICFLLYRQIVWGR